MSAVLEMTKPMSAWRRSLAWMIGLQLLVLLVYRDTALAMMTIWERSETFAHAFLVLPIVLWLVWRERAVLAEFSPEPQPWLLLPLAAAAALWFMADLVAVNAATQFALVAMLVLIVPAVLGLRIAWQLLFPLAFMFFCVPVGEFMLPTLMHWTANFTVWGLQLSGIPVYREGQQFIIPSGSWSVVEACSGVRYLIASFMVGTLFAYLNYRSWQRRLAFCVVAVLVPIVANWVRAYLIVMIGHLSGNRLAVGVDHIIYGWMFFGVVILIMYMVGARWAEPQVPAPTAPAPREFADARAVAPLVMGCAAAVLLWSPQAALWAIDRGESAADVQLQLPNLQGGWLAGDEPLSDWKPEFENPSAESMRTYARGDQRVGLYVGYYRHQDYERKLVSSENVLVNSTNKGWVQMAQGSRALRPVGGEPVEVATAELRGSTHLGDASEQRLTVWKLYWIGGTLTSNDIEAKWLAARNRLLGRGDDSAAIVVFTPGTPANGVGAKLESFMDDNLNAIDAQLKRVMRSR